jgi:uncharacterized protein YxjI
MSTTPARPPFNARPGEQYTIRRKFFKLFGASFRVYSPDGRVVAYCKQKAFKLKEDIRLYTDETASEELLVIKARSVIDFGATYDVALPTGQVLGSLRRAGLASTFMRDSWMVFDNEGRQIAALAEEGSFMPILRRYVDAVSIFSPQTFSLNRVANAAGDGAAGGQIATFRTHFNLISYRLSIAIKADDPELDDLMILAVGCLIAAIEGRQN